MPRPTGNKKSDALHIRIDEKMKKSIQEKVECGEYEDITDFIRTAIKNELTRENEEDRIEKIVNKIIEEKLTGNLKEKILDSNK
jgi:Arc/MetJ-type ribon-helix-helix transcriptional regulator